MISVVVTCYDLGRTLEDALDSVHGQTRPAGEVLVVDDGSTDAGTRRVLARLARRGTRVIRTDNRGVAAARNLGARLTVGDYLVFLDADDAFAPTYFAEAASRLDEDPALDFVTCALRAFEGASYVWTPAPLTWVEAVATGGVPHISSMTRRRLWDAIGGYDESLRSFEPLDFWATVLERGFKGIVLPEPLLRYRVRADSGYHQSIQRETYLDRMRHFYRKHAAALERHAPELIVGRETFVLDQRAYRRGLLARAEALESERAALEDEIRRLRRTLEADGRRLPEDASGTGDVPSLDEVPAETGDGAVGVHVDVTCPESAAMLMYHHVARLEPDPRGLCLEPADFRRHMEHLRRHYRPMPLEELARAVATGRIPPRAIAVTIDDGYLDALTQASPILLDTGVPATFFVNSAGFDEAPELLGDVLDRIFLAPGALPAVLELEIHGERTSRPTVTADARQAAARWIREMTFPASAAARDAVMRRVVEWSGLDLPPRPTHRRLTARELAGLAARPGHAIGSHTVHHLALPFHDRTTQRREIEDDRARLEGVIGRRVTTFAYPYGEFSAATVEIVRASGFVAAVTCRETLAVGGGDPLLLPRLEVRPADGAGLARRLDTLFGGP
jgi:glycosyltransferase involved in cell wall biosynthesis/peptidoglycan/xylan/chitin deacetylase (PgdA/CDA1 family)